MEKTFFLYENGQVSQPYTLDDLRQKNLTGDTMICEKYGTWKPVREIPELEELWEWATPMPPPPLPQKEEVPPEIIETKPVSIEPEVMVDMDLEKIPKKRGATGIKLAVGVLSIIVLATAGYFFLIKPNSGVLGDSEPGTSLTVEAELSEIQIAAQQNFQNSPPLSGSIIAQKNLNVRDSESVNGAKLGLLKQLEEVKVLARGRKDVVEGIEDYWYQVSYKNKTGYVFGHYTNLKLQGQKTVILPFEGCAFGDLFHLTFGSPGSNSNGYLDFGQGMNNYSGFELCLEDREGMNYPNPKYVGKKFKITFNDLYAKTYCNAPVSYDEICIVPVKTIVRLELADPSTSSTSNKPPTQDYQFDRHNDIEIFMEDLAKAVGNKDKDALAKMIHFPLVDEWGDNPANGSASLGCKDKQQFIAKYDEIFCPKTAQSIRNKKYRAYTESDFGDIINLGEYLIENDKGIGMPSVKKIAGKFKIYALKFYS